MTVSSTTNKSGPYLGNGSTVDFDYEFRILDPSHVTVVMTEDGVDTTVSPSDYTVSGVGASVGGTLTFLTAPATGQSITIIRDAPFTQPVDLENQGAYYAETVEDALDLAAMRDQQLAEGLSRAVQIPVGADAGTLAGLIEDIVRLSDSADEIDTVAGIAAQVSTVAGISANVTTVAGIAADVSAVAAIAADVSAVENIAASVVTVAGIAAAVADVSAISAEVEAAAAIAADVTTVADNIAAVNTAATNIAAIVAAPGHASSASTSASTATAQASNASTSATAASNSASAAANSVASLPYTFSTTTTDADPGAGLFRLNNAAPGSATAAYIDNTDADGVAATGVLDTWDDSTSPVRGVLTIRSKTNATIRHTYNVTGSVVDGTGYRKLTLAYVGGSGTLTNGAAHWLIFNRTGDAGEVTLAGTQTLTNKTLTSPTITTPTLTLKQGATATPTAEGAVEWDTDDNVLAVGDGAATRLFVPIPASTAAGDLEYFTSAKAKGRLALGAASTTLRVNAAGNGLEYGGGSGAPDAVLEYQVAANTDGGTATSGSWQTRPLNTEVLDPRSLISLSSNQFTVQADGWVEYDLVILGLGAHKTRLYNVTNSLVAAVDFATSSTSGVAVAPIVRGGGAVLAGKTYRVEYQCGNTAGTSGLGYRSGFSAVEVYARLRYWRN